MDTKPDADTEPQPSTSSGIVAAKRKAPQSKTSEPKKVKTPGKPGMKTKGTQTPKSLANPKRKACTSDCLRGTPKNLSDCPNALHKIKKLPKHYLSCHQVHDLLKGMGIESPESVNPCAKSAIRRGFLKVSGKPEDLEKVIYTGRMEGCGHEANAKLKHFLQQPPYGGHDYEEGSEDATILCNQCHGDDWTDEDLEKEDEIWRMYLTQVCTGNPNFDCGKFHNHCTACAGFGRCVGDHRNSHCSVCHDDNGWRGDCTNSSCRMSRKRDNFFDW